MNSTPNAGTPRILIVRLSHIGDSILTLPLACAIRRHYPGAHIAWAVESPTDQLLTGHPAIDEVIVVPRNWLRRFGAVSALGKTLRHDRFDLVFDPQSLTKSAALAWLSGAADRVGFARPYGRELAPWLNRRLVRPLKPHLVDRTLELLTALGVADRRVEFRLPVSPAALTAVRPWIRSLAPQGFVAMNPGGLWASKRWEMDRFAQVAATIQRRHDLASIVVWGGRDERQMAEQIARASKGIAQIAPATSLRELVAALSLARMYLGGDTGPMHMAAAVGTPCVGLFGPTRPIDSGPYGEGHVALQAWYQAGTCRQRRGGTNAAMRDISVELVCAAISKVNRSQRAHGRFAA
jgi:lipopolysaccharide heptosyltransferase I